MKNHEEMKNAVSRIITLATLLQSADERGDLMNLGDGAVADVSALIGEQARTLEKFIIENA